MLNSKLSNYYYDPLIVIVILALIFDYINGFHDAANSIATIVSTKVLTPFQAVVWAAFLILLPILFLKTMQVNTIGNGYSGIYYPPCYFSRLNSCHYLELTYLVVWYSSSSHTLIGGFAGAAITHAFLTRGLTGIGTIVELKKIIEIVLFIFLAPLIGMIISIYITVITIMRNLWAKVGLIILTGIGTWFLFAHFEQTN